MHLFRDRRILLGAGAALAVALGLGLAALIMLRDPGSQAPPPASKGGLVVEEGNTEPVLDPGRPLRCFVGGQLVGTMTLAECARKNGVATRALDLGVDSTGALAAASDTGPVVQSLTPAQAEVTPLVPPPAAPPEAAAPPAMPLATRAGDPTAPCWRRDADWRRLPSDLSLNGCVQALFAGRCVKAGDAAYGRWGLETLRLLPRRVEISSDNRTFRALVDQSPGCAIPPIPGTA